ncbi:MAG: XDD4 family exosortase-dependent surface protein [Planctomycetia bacterium]
MHTLCLTHRIVLATKVLLPWIGILVAATVFAVLPADGAPILISGTGQTPANGGFSTVSANASLDIVGNKLTVVLNNTSPTDTTFQSEALSSFYFDIVRGTKRPTLTFTSADGPLYKLLTSGSDQRYSYQPPTSANGNGTFTPGAGPSNLIATKPGDGTWQYLPMTPTVFPFLGFGIGTVGNNSLSPNGFNGNWVNGPKNIPGNSMISFSIYRSANGDISPSSGLNNQYLLRNTGTFTFTIKDDGTKWSTTDIRKEAMFGFGTGPDGKLIVAPEPSAYAIALIGVAAVACRQRFRRKGRVHHAPVP